MKKIVASGLLAALFIACSGPGAQLTSHAMLDAGEALQDAGMGSVGQKLTDAGTALRDASTPDGGTADAQSAPDGLPSPHWVLRDVTGQALQAQVSPVNVATGTRFTTTAPDCMLVEYVGQQEIELFFKPSTGTLVESCTQAGTAASWHTSRHTTYADVNCTQAVNLTAGDTADVASKFYYTDGTGQHVSTYYTWSGSCVAVTPAGGQDVWMFKQVPASVSGLLPDAPYTLELRY